MLQVGGRRRRGIWLDALLSAGEGNGIAVAPIYSIAFTYDDRVVMTGAHQGVRSGGPVQVDRGW